MTFRHVKALTAVFALLALLGASITPVAAAESNYAMVVFLKGSEFFNWAYGGMQDAAELIDEDINVELRGPSTWDATEEAKAIRQLIARDVDGILTTAGAARTMAPAIDEAIERGIPVITFDSDAPYSNRLAFASTNQFKAGQLAGEEIVEWLDGEGQVAISTNPGPSHLKKRVNGFKSALKGTDVEVIATVNDEGKIAAAESKITAALQANPQIDVIFGAHGNPGIGAAAAVKNVGRSGEVDIMAFDFAKPVVKKIDQGEIRATVGQNPYLMGYMAMFLAWSANQETGVQSRNEPFGHVPPKIETGVKILYKDDVQQYLNPPDFVTGG